MSGDVFGYCQAWRCFWLSGLGRLLVLNSERLRMLLNILQCTGQPPQQRIIQPKSWQCLSWDRKPWFRHSGLTPTGFGIKTPELGYYSCITPSAHIKGFLILMVSLLADGSRNPLSSGPPTPQRAGCFLARQKDHRRGRLVPGRCATGPSVRHAISVFHFPFWAWY